MRNQELKTEQNQEEISISRLPAMSLLKCLLTSLFIHSRTHFKQICLKMHLITVMLIMKTLLPLPPTNLIVCTPIFSHQPHFQIAFLPFKANSKYFPVLLASL